MWRQWLADNNMLFVLILLCGLFSVLTMAEQHPVGIAAAKQLSGMIGSLQPAAKRVLIVIRNHPEDVTFAESLAALLKDRGMQVETARGGPAEARAALEKALQEENRFDVIACTDATSSWGVIERLAEIFPKLAPPKHAPNFVMKPQSYRWPNFLKLENLRNITNQIAVIAMVAIGMTMVIIAGQIDLSVGSLVAFSAVVAARIIRDHAGAENATIVGQILACCAAILLSAVIGAASGSIVTRLRMPSFIVTLGMMRIAGGSADILSAGQSINQVPESFIWLGRKADLFQIPNSVVLMLVLYLAAHIVMNRTIFGRYLYAVGGNPEAARLSGVPVRAVTIAAFTICGALAGLGGVVLASQLKSGAPTYGQMYELYIIAAVVVGGTSLSGGEGRIFGTLVGAFIIAVIQNGMNLLNIESYTQKVVLGVVILVAVALDRSRRTRS